MTPTDINFRVIQNPWDDKYELGMFHVSEVGVKSIVTGVTLTQVEPGMVMKPAFCMDRNQGQELFNQLWQQGFRPKDGTGNGGHIEAVKYHLEDMRRLVFEKGRA